MANVLQAFVLPSNICFVLTFIGLALSIPARTRKAALGTFIVGGVLLFVFSSGKTAAWLMSPLEYAYPRIADRPVAGVRSIVILAAYAAPDPEMSLSDRPNSAALYRIVEGSLLWHKCRDCDVIVTGLAPTTTVMADLLVALGVPQDHVRLDNGSANTGASARNVRGMVGDAPFYLVTSAGHLPRAMAAFEKAGTRPLAAPTDHRLPRLVAQADWNLLPFHLEVSDVAVHERLGMWWYRWRGVM